jgi:hypothetical protein
MTDSKEIREIREIEDISNIRDIITELVGNNIFNYTSIKDLFTDIEQKSITEKFERILVEEMRKKDIDKYINRIREEKIKRLEENVKEIKNDIDEIKKKYKKTRVFEEHQDFKDILDKILFLKWKDNEDVKDDCINDLFDSTFFWNYHADHIFAGKYNKIMDKWRNLVNKINSKNIELLISDRYILKDDKVKLENWYQSYQK